MSGLRLAIQRRLEGGTRHAGVSGALLARGWGRLARVARPLTSRAPSLCVGGSTLGGSGKTPLAIACARFLAERGHRVALVAHAYRASPPHEPRRVKVDDDVATVGDEALECARALGPLVTVMVARRRQDALDAASRFASVVVLDGPLQLAPRRATLSLLALDHTEPWGSGACPPLGNLRAPRAVLLEATDRAVPIGAAPDPTVARVVSRGVHHAGALVGFRELASLRVGLVTGVARPSRIVALLRARGVAPCVVVEHADHTTAHPPRANPPRAAEVDLWLTTAKDACRGAPGRRAAVIDYHLDLPASVRNELVCRFPFRF